MLAKAAIRAKYLLEFSGSTNGGVVVAYCDYRWWLKAG